MQDLGRLIALKLVSPESWTRLVAELSLSDTI